MDLYFLRHGEADWPDWKKSDDERPLTKHGKKEMHEVAKFLKRAKARPDLIITSPLPRASQTAEIAAKHLKVKCHKDKLIAPATRVPDHIDADLLREASRATLGPDRRSREEPCATRRVLAMRNP